MHAHYSPFRPASRIHKTCASQLNSNEWIRKIISGRQQDNELSFKDLRNEICLDETKAIKFDINFMFLTNLFCDFSLFGASPGEVKVEWCWVKEEVEWGMKKGKLNISWGFNYPRWQQCTTRCEWLIFDGPASRQVRKSVKWQPWMLCRSSDVTSMSSIKHISTFKRFRTGCPTNRPDWRGIIMTKANDDVHDNDHDEDASRKRLFWFAQIR